VKPYLISLAAGILVGGIYSLISVRSPAPPAIALIGLLGILLGEQVVLLIRQAFGTTPASAATTIRECGEHVFGLLPGRGHSAADPASGDKS
jgi:XapX domain-containing protein